MTHVRPVRPDDAQSWFEMRCALWPEEEPRALRADVRRFFAGELREPLETLVAEDESGRLIGFAELSVRPYAEGCVTEDVAYLEGWYVVPEARRRGVGGALVRAAEAWGRGRHCMEFASDAVLDNAVSAAAHRALGFQEVVQIRCFRKDLAGG